MQNLTVLGSTGSIGVNTLDVVARHADRYRVFALTGNSQIDLLAEQCQRFNPRYAVVPSTRQLSRLKSLVPPETQVLAGVEGLESVAADASVDIVMAAIVGGAGLAPTMAAVEAGKKVLLANKEALVMAGAIFMRAARRYDAKLLPIDSEHNAIFQCLPAMGAELEASQVSRVSDGKGIRRLILSGSGGPFRTTPIAELAGVSADQACAHPNWQMGRKISVDSATMMNKGLELIEACWLFDVSEADVDIVIHPESIVHSLVEYTDGSVLAQLGNPDMRIPIAHALGWPERIDSGAASLDLVAQGALQFESPDEARFPLLALARDVARRMDDWPIALNAANEVAVAAFLRGEIGYLDIARLVGDVIACWSGAEPADIGAVREADAVARTMAAERLGKTGRGKSWRVGSAFDNFEVSGRDL